ncbi:MAG: hypothetical protein LCH32_10360 [Bacteroidetes bacterium]|nr:hypothetical protein [Bacteroidota bacterium]
MSKISNITKCPWCRSEFLNSTISNCSNCGGTLEYQKVINDIGPKPPLAPRDIPAKFIRRIKYTGNVYTMIGIIFTVPFFWTVIFPIIGIILWKKGLKEANEELIPLKDGIAVKGEITSIEFDRSKTINGKHPLEVTFSFNANGKTLTGQVGNIFDPINNIKQVGDGVWVVYMPEDPNLSSVWPPLK